MKSAPASALLALALIISTMPSNAQFFYSPLELAAESSAINAPEPEKAPITTYKLVHGVIQGEQGVLIGATVWLRGTRNIAVTNAEGEFELRVPADAKAVELLCSYGGLQEEVVHLAPVEAIGSVYLLRGKNRYSAPITLTQ